jgi:hypothetical protein
MNAIKIANQELFSALEEKKKQTEFWFPEIPLDMPIGSESTAMEIQEVYNHGFKPVFVMEK